MSHQPELATCEMRIKTSLRDNETLTERYDLLRALPIDAINRNACCGYSGSGEQTRGFLQGLYFRVWSRPDGHALLIYYERRNRFWIK